MSFYGCLASVDEETTVKLVATNIYISDYPVLYCTIFPFLMMLLPLDGKDNVDALTDYVKALVNHKFVNGIDEDGGATFNSILGNGMLDRMELVMIAADLGIIRHIL